MNRLSVLGLVVLVFIGGIALVGPASAASGGTNVSDPTASGAQFVITVYENGSARLTQRYTQPLGNRTQVQQFRSYADRFMSKETPLYTDFKTRASGLTEEGSNATGREMHARGFTRSARVVAQPATTGVIEMSFLWTNFTAETEGGPTIGDAFENGLALSSDMALELRAGPNLSVEWQSVNPTPDASTNGSANTTDSLTYFGPAQFASGHPHVSFTTDSSIPNGTAFSSPIALAAVAVVILGVIAVVTLRYSGTAILTPDDGADTAVQNDRDTATRNDDTDVPTRNGSGTDDTADTNEQTMPEGSTVTDADLRSDEDRVVAVLEANGGRMPQSRIVEETGWSKSKVSTVLSGMADEGSVSKLRIGRENIVSLAGHEPTAAGSPFGEN